MLRKIFERSYRAVSGVRGKNLRHLTRSSLFSAYKTEQNAQKKSTIFRRYSTDDIPDNTRSATEKEMLKAFFNVDNLTGIQQLMMEAHNKRVSLGEFLQELASGKFQLYAAFEEGKLAAMGKTNPKQFPSFKPASPNIEYFALFVHTDPNSHKLLNPASKLELRPIPLEFVMDLITSNANDNQLSHIVMDPGLPWGVVLNQENFRFLPVYNTINKLKNAIETLWRYSPHSVNPDRFISSEPDQLAQVHAILKDAPLLLCKNEGKTILIKDNTTIPIWTSLDEVKEFLANYPQYKAANYQAHLAPAEFWNDFKDLPSSVAFVEFNPGSTINKVFKYDLVQEFTSKSS